MLVLLDVMLVKEIYIFLIINVFNNVQMDSTGNKINVQNVIKLVKPVIIFDNLILIFYFLLLGTGSGIS